MNIVKWNFPTFEEWHKNNDKYDGSIGDYYCAIRAVTWYQDKPKAEYMCAISTSSNPLNIYSEKIVRISSTIEYEDLIGLQAWYESTIKSVQVGWEKYINETYFIK